MMSLAVTHWPYETVFARLALALALGLFVGIERERRRKDAGLRTFGFVALLGALGGLLGDNFAMLTIALLAWKKPMAGFALLQRQPRRPVTTESQRPLLNLQSPFSLKSALKFGVILVVIQMAGVLGQQTLGQLGIYVTSLLGGLFSSSSAVAAAAALAAQGAISAQVAGNCAIIASLMSVVVNLPLILGLAQRRLVWRIAWSVGIVAMVGGLGAWLQSTWLQFP